MCEGAGEDGGVESLEELDLREKEGAGDARPTVNEPLVEVDEPLLDVFELAGEIGGLLTGGSDAVAAATAESSMVSTSFVCFGRLGLFDIHLRDWSTTECPARAVTRGILPALGNSVRYARGVQHPAAITRLSQGMSEVLSLFTSSGCIGISFARESSGCKDDDNNWEMLSALSSGGDGKVMSP
jgi:hypothetical protein